MKLSLRHILPAAAIALVISCAEHDLNVPAPPDSCSSLGQVSYAQSVQPIIASSCAISGCHDGSLGVNRNWTVFDRLKAKSQSVKDRITRPVGTAGHMPQNGTLTAAQIQTIVCWVDQGANNN